MGTSRKTIELKSDAIIVLDGDPMGELLLRSVQLWKSGYAPKVILSARLAKWQTYDDYHSWRYAMKLKMFPEGTMSGSTTFSYEFSKIIWYTLAE